MNPAAISPISRRTLGRDLEVSVIGLGCMGLTHGFPPFPNRAAGIALVRAA